MPHAQPISFCSILSPAHDDKNIDAAAAAAADDDHHHHCEHWTWHS